MCLASWRGQVQSCDLHLNVLRYIRKDPYPSLYRGLASLYRPNLGWTDQCSNSVHSNFIYHREYDKELHLHENYVQENYICRSWDFWGKNSYQGFSSPKRLFRSLFQRNFNQQFLTMYRKIKITPGALFIYIAISIKHRSTLKRFTRFAFSPSKAIQSTCFSAKHRTDHSECLFEELGHWHSK